MIRFIFFVFISGTVLTRSLEPYHVSLGSSVWGYFTPPVLKRPQQLQTPMEAMVDLTNSLGVAILQDHSYSRGNFAFSPYGVASVLVVLYEGARGESANQIYRAVGFPSNKDILRTGFRDIHRHLRSYFSHEGFLSGITLNKNGSNLKSEYKKILKFYGYDVELSTHLEDDCKEHNSSTEGIEPSKPAVTTTLQPVTEKPSTSTETKKEETDLKIGEDDLPVKKPEESFSTEKEITEGGDDTFTTTLVTPVKETFQTTDKANDSELDVTTALSLKEQQLTTVGDMNTDQKTTAETTMVTSELTTESTVEESTQTEIGRVKKRNESVTEKSDYDEIKLAANAFPEDVTVNTPGILEPDDYKEKKFQENLETGEKKEKCRQDRDPNGRSQESEILCKEEEELERTGDDRTESPIKALESKPKEVKTDSEEIKLDNGMLIPQVDKKPTKEDLQETTSEFSLLEFTTNAIDSNESKEGIFVEESSGQKSSGGPDKIESAINPNKDRWEKQLRKMFDSKSSLWVFEPRKKSKRTFIERHRRTIADYLKWPLNPDLSLQLQNGMYDTHVSRNAEMYRSLPRIMFLVDGAVDTPVPMMTYTNIFPYGYIPKLHAKALEFPLDDIRYKLLIVLPIERRGLRQLIYDLADFSVRDVLKCLQPTRVKAMIPTFMVEGFVILTSSLQKLGIWDVFDPRKANLSGMSVDPELHVRNIEQSVTVVIRNYVEILDIQTRTMAARYLEHEFQATHPFVYFVLDTATNIALMAGQMLDPLNSRIY